MVKLLGCVSGLALEFGWFGQISGGYVLSLLGDGYGTAIPW
jgi:hypothetical protein